MIIKHTSTIDQLDRKQDVQFFTSLLETISEPYVMSIEAPWGSGKSFFIQLWEKYLLAHKYECITFNAWENDFTGDPFVTIIGELSLSMETTRSITTDAQEKFNTVKEYASLITKHLLKSGVKIATGLSLNLEDTGIERAIGEGLSNISDSYLEQYKESKNSVSKFKESLQVFADEIRSSTGKPLVIFIDELDRCRPDYTIDLLEAIKHFFNTNNIVFVLAVDRKALKNSVASVFSNEIDVDSYLRKFVDISLNLPIRNIEEYTRNIANETFSFQNYKMIDLFSKISALNNENFRRIEQTLSFIHMITVSKYSKDLSKQELVGFLVALKAYYPKEYQLLKEKNVYQALLNIRSNVYLKKLLKNQHLLYAVLLGATVPPARFQSMLTIYDNARLPDTKERTNRVLDYNDIPFKEEGLKNLLDGLEVDIARIRDKLSLGGINTVLFEIISGIELVEGYTI